MPERARWSIPTVLALVGFIALCELVGVLGALTVETGEGSWYRALVRPSFNPPGWVFGPVWTLLYALMGIAAFLLWRRRGGAGTRLAAVLFAAQLLLNALWTPVFFGAHSIAGALAILAALLVALLATIVASWRVSRAAAGLLLPYLAWSGFATVLNAAILRLNG